MDGTAGDSILIPIGKSAGEVVEVPISGLPEDVNQIIEILQAEIAPLDLWIRFAVEYHKKGNDAAAKEILEEGGDDEVEKMEEYKHATRERANIQNILAGFYIAQARYRPSFHIVATARHIPVTGGR